MISMFVIYLVVLDLPVELNAKVTSKGWTFAHQNGLLSKGALPQGARKWQFFHEHIDHKIGKGPSFETLDSLQ
jgi:hypothetical protein